MNKNVKVVKESLLSIVRAVEGFTDKEDDFDVIQSTIEDVVIAIDNILEEFGISSMHQITDELEED